MARTVTKSSTTVRFRAFARGYGSVACVLTPMPPAGRAPSRRASLSGAWRSTFHSLATAHHQLSRDLDVPPSRPAASRACCAG